MSNILFYLFLGLIAGALSGLIGIGGGVIIVPALVFCLGFPNTKPREQHWLCWFFRLESSLHGDVLQTR